MFDLNTLPLGKRSPLTAKHCSNDSSCQEWNPLTHQVLSRAAEEPAHLGMGKTPSSHLPVQGEHVSATQTTEFTLYTQLTFKNMLFWFQQCVVFKFSAQTVLVWSLSEYGMKMEASPIEYAAKVVFMPLFNLNSFSADNSRMEQCFHKLTHTFGRH